MQTETTNLSDIDRSRIIRRMMTDHGMEEARAAAAFEETIRFLGRCAASLGARLVPTPEIDKGWHTFMLYTRAYRAFCRSIGSGRFIDHEPNDLPEPRDKDEGTTCFVHCNGKATPAGVLAEVRGACNSGTCENPCSSD